MRNRTDINFYISNVKGDNTSDMAFSVAYKASKDSKNNKELCACYALMLSCSWTQKLRQGRTEWNTH